MKKVRREIAEVGALAAFHTNAVESAFSPLERGIMPKRDDHRCPRRSEAEDLFIAAAKYMGRSLRSG
jgi:hypothetical protein